jgi:hypothetical protein
MKNTDQDQDAKRAAIYDLLKGYWQLAEKLDRSLLNSYLNPVEDISVGAVLRTCQRIASGQAGLNSSFPPTPADIAERARSYDEATADRVPQYNGLLDMDWGHGRVDLRGLTNDEQDAIIRNHGMIGIGENAKNAALMTLDEKIAALRDLKQLPPSKPMAPAVERKPWLEEDNWVQWSPEWGDFPPIDREARVWVKFRDGALSSQTTELAKWWDWSDLAESTIIAYKIDRRIQ